jgi:hypothetical protein
LADREALTGVPREDYQGNETLAAPISINHKMLKKMTYARKIADPLA